MKVSGFTFIRNAITYDYPVREAILSILPLCDEVIVAVGKSDDDTLSLIKNIAPDKIKIVETVWDDRLREGGKVLAVETDKALARVSGDSDWAIYIQGDEVLHEKYLEIVRSAMLENWHNKKIDGLLFKYLHFYASYDFIGKSSNWYRNEIRIIRPNTGIYSYKDAQGFRKNDNEKLHVKAIDAFIYHYGWVKPPAAMQRKQQTFHKLWHSDDWVKENVENSLVFNYEKYVRTIDKFRGTHPQVMQARIAQKNWTFKDDISFHRFSAKDLFKNCMRNVFGVDLGYKNYVER